MAALLHSYAAQLVKMMQSFDEVADAKVQLSEHWQARFLQVVPDVYSTIRLRLAWCLATETISTDDQLERLGSEALLAWPAVGSQCLALRDLYLHRREKDHD